MKKKAVKEELKEVAIPSIVAVHLSNDGNTNGLQFMTVNFADGSSKEHEVTEEQYAKFEQCFRGSDWKQKAGTYYSQNF